jgi:hypothetical protein
LLPSLLSASVLLVWSLEVSSYTTVVLRSKLLTFTQVDQVWWTGPIARHAGGAFGGDVGFELSFAFAASSYFVLRHIELRYFGR